MFNETVYGDGGLRPRRRYGLSAGLSDSIITEGGRQYRLWEKDGISYRTDLGPVPVATPDPAVPEVVRDTRMRRPKRYRMRRYQPRQRFVPQPRRPQRRPVRFQPPKRIRFDIHPLPPIRVIPPAPVLYPVAWGIPGKGSKALPPATGGVKCPTGMVPLNGRCVKAPRFDIHPLPPMLGGLSDLAGCGCESGEASGAGSQLLASVNVQPARAEWWSGISTALIFQKWNQQAQATIGGLPSHLQVLSQALSPDNGNITVNLRETIDRNDVRDIASDLAIAAQRAGFTVRGQMAAVKVPVTPGTVPAPGTVPPGAGNVDTQHDDDTTIGTALEFWLKGAGDVIPQQFSGITTALAAATGLSPQVIGIAGIGLIAFLLLKK
jgi:hypothetical protein